MSKMELIETGYCYPMYIFYNDRLETFSTWSIQVKPDKHELTKAVFFILDEMIL